ncbi:hypothetical protein QJS04_geneDACA013334 [Acorus gramineus]|uniref:Uncharacterized protein n=1 Tax=Acorus gramineus TaxID=55184 RepID=A0AAV9AA72_ACOGR|nr:hypothetical protein QJS04_geneDACA013334 [Acorus gramineus]
MENKSLNLFNSKLVLTSPETTSDADYAAILGVNCHECQEVLPTPGQPVTESMFIPVAVGLLDSKGKDMPLTSVHHEALLQSVVSNGCIMDMMIYWDGLTILGNGRVQGPVDLFKDTHFSESKWWISDEAAAKHRGMRGEWTVKKKKRDVDGGVDGAWMNNKKKKKRDTDDA